MKDQNEIERPIPRDWRLLQSRKEEFSRILQLLVDFDDKTGRALRYRDQETHHMRKAIAVGNPDLRRVYMRRIATDTFSIVSELICDAGMVVTGWLHEDGVHAERAAQPPEHPVHSIICVSDLFENDSTQFAPTRDLNPVTRALLSEVEFAANQ